MVVENNTTTISTTSPLHQLSVEEVVEEILLQ
ncbi:hypothetical protein EmuJ_000933900 [Echinococcus multilocularis]|uniref:Uncharacterized protein n=1 Tax=Echinococcus multilocularis TaxID=6211 RepID=A0A068YEC8_ECHMU|nr:hypothetical protein EmuJ_000933900 [Echinococcus multilocularis]